MRMELGALVVTCAALAVPVYAADKAGPLIRSAKSGAWSAGATWEGGAAPATGDRVQVRAGGVMSETSETPPVAENTSLRSAATR